MRKNLFALGLLAIFLGSACSATTFAEPTQVGTTIEPVGLPVNPGMEAAYTADPFEQPAEHLFEAFGIIAELPEKWEPVEGEIGRVEGTSGYTNANAGDTESGLLADMCAAEAEHKMQPYGSRPTVEQITVDGQPGCRILPSEDQPSEGNYWAGVVVTYPQPWSLNGNTYRFLILTSDLPHINGIIETLRFA